MNKALIQARRLTLLCIAASIPMLSAPTLASAEDYLPGPWHFSSIPCTDSIVTEVRPRLTSVNAPPYPYNDFQSSGVMVGFKTALGSDPAKKNLHAGIASYQGTPGNDIIINERPGDRVQVCLLLVPAPTAQCNPDKDSRGRLYRIYDYRQHAQYSGENSMHTCGGA